MFPLRLMADSSSPLSWPRGRGIRAWHVIARAGCHGVSLPRAATAGQPGVDNIPGVAVADNRDGAALVGAQEGNLVLAEQGDRFGVWVAVVVSRGQAGDGRFGLNQVEPALVGAVAAAVMGELEDCTVANQAGIVRQPPLPFVGLAVAGHEDRELAVFQADADRIVILLLVI